MIDLGEIQRRPSKYWNADGLPEVTMGLLWILWGSAWIVGDSLPRGAASNIYWTLAPLLLVLTGTAAVWVTKKLKARITFPRAGYVAWHEPTTAQRLTSAAVAAITATFLAALVIRARAQGIERVAPAIFGVVFSLGFVVASLTQQVPHMLALAGVALMLGLAFAGLNLGWQSTNWMLVGLGTATLLSGILRLGIFLKRNPLEHRA